MKKIHTILFTACLIISSCGAEEETPAPPSNIQTQEPVPEPEPTTPDPVQYTLTVTAGDGGTVSTEGGTYDEGTQVTVTATPQEGYEFVGWEGDVSEESELSITLNSNLNISAIFEFICIEVEVQNYNLPSYNTFKIQHPKDITQVNENIYEYLHKYGTEKISLDYNKDGFLDMISYQNDYQVNNNRQPIYFYLGDCQGNLTIDEVNSNRFDGLIHGRKILLGDFNNDSYPDVFLIGHGWDYEPFPGEYPVILFSSPSGEFSESRLYDFSAFHHGGASGDWDNDGDLDIILTTSGNPNDAHSFMHLVNDGTGTFSINNDLGDFTNNKTNNFQNCEIYDLDKDGFLDVLFMCRTENLSSSNSNNKSDLGTIILYGNGNDFEGEIKDIPNVEGWEQVYDAEFIDINGNGTEEIILNRISMNNATEWYIQIIELIDGEYVDNTQNLIDIYTGTGSTWNVYLEVRDIDNDGVIELINNIPKAVDEKAVSECNEPPCFYYHEWELSNGRFIKVH